MAQDSITQEEADAEMARIVDDVKAVGGAIVELARDGALWASPAQWARARALSDANDWVTSVVCGGIGFDPHHMQISPAEAQRTMERLAERWAAWIESGEMPESVER